MKKYVYRIGIYPLRLYWFLFRPKTQGVKCLIISDNQLLLIRHTYGNSAWTLPGGGIKHGEIKELAVQREIKEELGLTIDPEYLGEFTHNTEYKIDRVYCFVIKMQKFEPQIDPTEIREAKWWPVNNLPDHHSTGLQRILRMYESR